MKNTLTGLCIVFLLVMLVEMTRSYDFSADSGATQALVLELPQQQGLEQMSEISDYDEIIERPLFAVDRQPFVPDNPETEAVAVVDAKAPEPPSREGYSLSGVVLTDEIKMALIESKRANSVEHLVLGQRLDGWELTEIQENFVTLQQGDGQMRLELVVEPSPKQARQTPAGDGETDAGQGRPGRSR